MNTQNHVLAITLMLAAGTAIAAPAPARQTADSIWSGGAILTMNDKAMRAEAVAVANGKIIAVGSRKEVMKLKGPGTQLVDLAGQTLVPGFVDAHGHVMVGGLQALAANLLAPPDGRVLDIASLQQTLCDWAKANAAVVDKVLKAVDVKPGAQLVERQYGMFEVHSENQAEVLRAGA